MAAKFILKKGSTGKYRFNLVATNGQVIATSEAYESKASAINGIESVKRNAPQRRDRRPDRQVAHWSALGPCGMGNCRS
jgi:uncharacterized protein YegP (UPF0339 family)